MSERQLVIGGSVDGGFFVLTDQGLDRIDALSTSGFAVDAAGERLARIVSGGSTGNGELVVYDAAGALCYRRFDQIWDPHDVLWDGDELEVVSSGTNSVVRLSGAGVPLDAWRAHGEGDSWHLNCLLRREGRLLVSAFGEYDRHQEWLTAGDLAGAGLLLDIGSGEKVLTGLNRPHHPRWIDGAWLICESGSGAVTRLSEHGERLQSVDIGGWTRGVAVDDDRIYVGISVDRAHAGDQTASVAVLDRSTLAVLDRFAVPAREIYDLQFVPAVLIEGVRKGFDTNAVRRTGLMAPSAMSEDQVGDFDAVPLAPEVVAVSVRLEDVPPTVVRSRLLTLGWQLENLGSEPLSPYGPNGFKIGLIWSRDGVVLDATHRTTLPRIATGGAVQSGRLRVAAPDVDPGPMTLTVSLLQEHVHWLADVDPEHGSSYQLTLVAD